MRTLLRMSLAAAAVLCLLPAGAEQLYARLAEQEDVDEAALELARAYVDGMSLRGAA